MIQYVRAYIETFPTMESHYCKSSRSPTLYILYLKECREKNMENALQIQISKYYNIIYGTKSFLDGSWFYAQRYRNCEKICTRVFNDRLNILLLGLSSGGRKKNQYTVWNSRIAIWWYLWFEKAAGNLCKE